MNRSLEARLTELDLPLPPGLAERALAGAASPAQLLRHRAPRWAAIGMATAAVVIGAAVLGGAVALSGGSHSASAEEILGKAARAAGKISYHSVRRSENAGLPGGWEIDETWYGDAQHRRDERTNGSDPTTVTGNVVSGADVWIYVSENGTRGLSISDAD